jgi:hypothetical protein
MQQHEEVPMKNCFVKPTPAATLVQPQKTIPPDNDNRLLKIETDFKSFQEYMLKQQAIYQIRIIVLAIVVAIQFIWIISMQIQLTGLTPIHILETTDSAFKYKEKYEPPMKTKVKVGVVLDSIPNALKSQQLVDYMNKNSNTKRFELANPGEQYSNLVIVAQPSSYRYEDFVPLSVIRSNIVQHKAESVSVIMIQILGTCDAISIGTNEVNCQEYKSKLNEPKVRNVRSLEFDSYQKVLHDCTGTMAIL